MYQKYRTALAIAGLAAAGFIIIPNAYAEPDQHNESIVVTGTRQAYQGDFAPFETPQAELVIDSEMMEIAGATTLSQALDLSASVARQNNFGGLWNSFAIRGFVGDENSPSNYLVNGFNAGRGFGGPRDLSGIEAVEVLKGPRAALFGRGEPGGTINLVTKRPTFTKKSDVKISYGSYDRLRATADWTSPISDTTAVRLVGFYEYADSFRDTIETTRYGLNPSIAIHLNEQTQLVYELEYSHQEIPFDRGVLAIDGALGVIPESRFLGEPGDGPMEAEVIGHQLELQHDFNAHWSGLLGFNFRDTNLEGFSTEAELAASRQLLGSNFGDASSGQQPIDNGQTLTRQRRFRDYDANYKVVRAEVSGAFKTAGLQHRLLFGADVDRFEDDRFFLRARSRPLQGTPTPSLEQLQAINVFNPVYGQYPLPAPGPHTNRVETQKSFGVFFQDQISLLDNLDLRIGARYDDFRQKIHNRRNGTITKQSDNRISPQVGIVYMPSEILSLYSVYGENFRPLSGTDRNGDGHDPNKTRSFEAGFKFTLNDGRLVASAALFHIKQENILAVDDPSAFTFAAIGEAKSHGFEVDLYSEIAEDLRAWLSYSYVDAKTENGFFDANFGTQIPAGSDLLNIPKNTLSLQLIKSIQIQGRTLHFGGNLLYVGKRSGEFTSNFKLPDYTVVRTFADYSITKNMSIRAEIDNLFDEEYYTNSFSALWVEPGTPQNFRLSMNINF